MTREETIKVLSILKAAYPNSYKNMTKDEANATVTVWSIQFAEIPAEIVMIAVNKLIATSTFPPAISEIKDKIKGLYWEIISVILENKNIRTLTDEQESQYRRLLDMVESVQLEPRIEPTIRELVTENKKALN